MRYLLVLIYSFSVLMLSAQQKEPFTQHLQQTVVGQGIVTLSQDKEITDLINNLPKVPEVPVKNEASKNHEKKTENQSVAQQIENVRHSKYTGNRTRHKANGFRIEVYSAAGKSEAKRAAKQMEAKVRKAFPELSVYCHFKSPRWICRVGDFATREEAQRYLTQIKKQRISVEASIVNDVVLIAD